MVILKKIVLMVLVTFLLVNVSYTIKVRCGIGFCETEPKKCKKYDGCVNNKGCVYSAKVCNVPDKCSISAGCNATTDECSFKPIVCDDGIACTDNSCDPINGCMYTPNDSLCEDNNPCTTNVCTSSGCKSTPISCPPGKFLNIGVGLLCYPQICSASEGKCIRDPNALGTLIC